MFESMDEVGLVAAIAAATRAEAAAAARRCAAIAELTARRVGEDDDPRAAWVCDPWDSAAAEIAAAMNISHRKACGQMRIAAALRDHLPAVAALFAAGRLGVRVIAAITWRTRLITDARVWARIDAALAEAASRWGPLSDDHLNTAVDDLVARFDPAAVIAARQTLAGRDFRIGHYDDDAGVAAAWGTLTAADAEVYQKRLAAIVATVCEHDPRSAGERRSDAMGAIANRNDLLVCRCARPDCPAKAAHPTPKSSAVITVIANRAAIDAATAALAAEAAPPAPAPAHDVGSAILANNAVLPTPMLAELLRNGAKLQPLVMPDDEPEPRYRPSAKLARFIQVRDLTCRFPGCSMPAQFCDIDHVIPYPVGPTHPANLLCLCRKHHHLKTFWVGDWAVLLFADGTAVWTAPTGHTYTTHPGSRRVFPDFDPTVTEPPPPTQPPPAAGTDRGMKMPLRKRTRAAERAARINTERAHNNSDSDPPPF